MVNTKTGTFRTTMPTESTISRTTTNSTGISQGKRRALDAATKQTTSYNTRVHKVHNYAGKRHIEDLTNYAKTNNLNFDYNSMTQWLGSKVPNMQQLNWVGGAENTPNFYKNILGITAPVGAFGYAASSNNSTSSQYHKRGGQIKYFYD